MKFTSTQVEALHQLGELLLERQTNELWGLLETAAAIYCKRTATLAQNCRKIQKKMEADDAEILCVRLGENQAEMQLI